MARFVKLELELAPHEALAMDIYYVCVLCGPHRARLRWSEEGSSPTVVGDGLCAHALLEMNTLDNLALDAYIQGRQGRV